MNIEFAAVIAESFKFQELQLYAKWRVLHFKCPRNFFVWVKLMDYSIETVLVSFWICCFKLVTAMLFIFKFQHFGSHPLLNNFGLCIRFKKQFQWQLKLSCYC